MDVTTFQATCSVCGSEYEAQRKGRRRYCGNACQLRDARRKKLKLQILTEFKGLDYQTLIDPETGEAIMVTTVKFTPRGWELLGRYIAKTGQTPGEWVAEELRTIQNERLAPQGLEVGETRIVYPAAEEA